MPLHGPAPMPLQVLCSLLGWFCLYGAFRRSCGPRGAEWSCRLVALSHGVVIVLLTAFVLFVDGPWPFTHAGQCTTRPPHV
ncbi:Transmembrane protein 136 [Liparis tanakae]|uniref:Transmembrane protein 136 n=1 Tax=Liparis tanakae TaxID=230148 RepID=A0A4Z2EF94_9TELE|nr:Transmembrane protein 136 [Liparis tanakae]